MNSPLPFSTKFFLYAGIVFILQLFPYTGIFLMFVMAPYWSVILINAGMIGIAYEALTASVSRRWLYLPLAFYSGYYALAIKDRLLLESIQNAATAANASIRVPFDPLRQALVFETRGEGSYTYTYNLPVVYGVARERPEGFISTRMIDREICKTVGLNRSMRDASISTFGFHDEDSAGISRMEGRFCTLNMPERPLLPMVRVSQQEEKTSTYGLHMTRNLTTITTPEGKKFELQGGFSAPLKWFPMPVMGCGLNSGGPSWDCDAGFLRDGFTPIVPGLGKFGRDSANLAASLGLKRVAIADRIGADPSLVLEKIAEFERNTLAHQLAKVDAMVADPLTRFEHHDVNLIINRSEALASRAEAIMSGLERAVALGGTNPDRTKATGITLAQLLTSLPRAQFVSFRTRILALYAANPDKKHWLWEWPLLVYVGELGVEALPILRDALQVPRRDKSHLIQGLCRVGASGRTVAEPILLDLWASATDDHSAKQLLYVALRRIGIPLPPKSSAPEAALVAEWADISPSSPSRVCTPWAERMARDEEKQTGKRSHNIE
jgi:hypothetical protein